MLRLETDGLVLEEVAPGVDMEAQVIGQMQFRPRISDTLRSMDPALFTHQDYALDLNRP